MIIGHNIPLFKFYTFHREGTLYQVDIDWAVYRVLKQAEVPMTWKPVSEPPCKAQPKSVFYWTGPK